MSDRTTFTQSLPDRVFDGGVINHEEIERIRWKKWKEERQLQKQAREDELNKKHELEMKRLRKEFE
ncbi:hypothetical protein AAVH_36905 [Aphelenchoides avenae]|nr:hypothetical protein AAVH_36905 [Aphelenchus avenae]